MLWLIALLIILLEIRRMMDLATVQAKLTALQASVSQLIALPANPPPVDLQPLGDAVDAIQAEVTAKLAAPGA